MNWFTRLFSGSFKIVVFAALEQAAIDLKAEIDNSKGWKAEERPVAKKAVDLAVERIKAEVDKRLA